VHAHHHCLVGFDLAIELLEDLPDLDAIVTPVGGGGMLSGVAIAAKAKKSGIKVFGAEPLGADDAARSKATGTWVPQTNPQTIADGLMTSTGQLTWPVIRDLVEVAIVQMRERKRKDVQARAQQAAEERVLDALVGPASSPATRDSFRKKLRAGELNDKEIEIEVAQSGGGMPLFEIPGMPGAQMGAISIGDIFGKLGGGRTKTRRVNVRDSYEILINEESDKLLDSDQLTQEAIRAVENNGIVFLDEIDKICARSEMRGGGDVSREGVQRDLLPLIEGTTVATKHGQVKTDHILFIASGAFHSAKPSDLLPELQGRLPIRVELKPLTTEDLRRILTEPEASLVKQYIGLLQTEGVTLKFTDDSIDALADIAAQVNSTVENIGARRLQTVMERVLDEISFDATDKGGETIQIDAAYVRARVGDLAKNADLSKFIL
jgi:ATP-dependent HslUV protease ATP-binding subunit HslU